MKIIINGCVTNWVYGKSLIFYLMPDVFDWYYSVIMVLFIKKLATTSTTNIDLPSVYLNVER